MLHIINTTVTKPKHTAHANPYKYVYITYRTLVGYTVIEFLKCATVNNTARNLGKPEKYKL